MKILGIDASLSSTGWCIINEDEEVLLYGKICTKAKYSEFERIYTIAIGIKKIIEENSINLVVCEDQYVNFNPKTALTLSRLLGAIIYVCEELKVQIELISPTSARRILLGKGNSTKKDVAFFINENYINLGEYSDKQTKTQEKNSDIFDALCVSLAWLKKYILDRKYNK